MYDAYVSVAALLQVYCAHEYTAANAKFAVHADPKNEGLQKLKAEIDAMRERVRSLALWLSCL